MSYEPVPLDQAACGIETELGIVAPDLELTDKAGIHFIRRIHPEWVDWQRGSIEYDSRERVAGRFDDPSEARHHNYLMDEEWRRDCNFLLGDAARLYLDGEHPEISSPVSTDPRMLVVWNRGGYYRVDQIRKLHEAAGRKYLIFRNNVANDPDFPRRSPRVRQSWGSHLDITGWREAIDEKTLIRRSLPWNMLQIMISGAGIVGSSIEGCDVDFQISQRAEFTVKEDSTGTISGRAIVCTRNYDYGVYADLARFRRHHIIHLDSNMLELPEYLKAGLNIIFLRAMEDGFIDDRFAIHDPVSRLHEISWDTELNGVWVWLINQRKSRSALDCLWDHCDLFWEYLETRHPNDKRYHDVVVWFSKVLKKLSEKDWPGLYGWLDWTTKKLFIEQRLAAKGKTWKDPLAELYDLRYHDNDHDAGLFYAKIVRHRNVVRIAERREILQAAGVPPPTRSRWLFATIGRYKDRVKASNFWNTVSFRSQREGGPEEYTTLYFDDPFIAWDDALARGLFSLPLPEFIVAIQQTPLSVRAVRGIPSKFAGDDEDDGRDGAREDSDATPWLDMASQRAMSGEKLPPTGLQIVKLDLGKISQIPHACNHCHVIHDRTGRVYPRLDSPEP